MMESVRNISIFVLLSSMFFSCDDSRVYDSNIDIKGKQWQVADTLYYDFTVQDSTQLNNFYYKIRYSTDYPYYNMYVKYYLLDSASQLLESKQSNMNLFDAKSGKPLGSGMGDFYDEQILFMADKKLPYAGKYSLKVIHYMRDEPLKGISAFGLKVEKVK
jgi:gliding motility-associated lipoprotein GldH